MAAEPFLGIAGFATAASCGFAAWMIIELVTLLWRRRSAERSTALEVQTDLRITRDLIAAINDQTDPRGFAAFNSATPRERLRAARHLIQLLRGQDRERLFQIAESARLFDSALAQLASPMLVRRIEAVRELEQFASAACVEGLLRCLSDDPSLNVRLEAAAALARIGRLPDFRPLIDMLQLKSSPLTKLHAALFRSVAARDCDALVALTCDDDYRDQRAALVDALGWTESFAVLATLEAHSADADPEVRCAAVRSARRIGHPGASTWITALLLDQSEHVVIQAVQACGALGLRETIPTIVSLLDNPSWWVRTRAAEALESLRPSMVSRRDSGTAG